MPLISWKSTKKSFTPKGRASSLSRTIRGKCSVGFVKGKVYDVGEQVQNPQEYHCLQYQRF